MAELPEDTTLDVIEQLIDEGETRRAEQVLLIEMQDRRGQDTTEAEQVLQEIEDTLAALHCRRAYLRAMQTDP
ncbi:hypothetical protein [Methylobacterium nodulans]|uniref:Uncharacterized protein n=1 Tax=Methylobacterium nodulans (strain LMG 21967 / CNCM I-2342 / ORS 2060) TaxID=460265 RepID=B8IQ94_METNO|nr:hypothetical protein [Methylobacterium nodulans]ACL58594.1 conserved hypothetical protein [Methylobacterium nodulans ORS 2060]